MKATCNKCESKKTRVYRDGSAICLDCGAKFMAREPKPTHELRQTVINEDKGNALETYTLYEGHSYSACIVELESICASRRIGGVNFALSNGGYSIVDLEEERKASPKTLAVELGVMLGKPRTSHQEELKSRLEHARDFGTFADILADYNAIEAEFTDARFRCESDTQDFEVVIEDFVYLVGYSSSHPNRVPQYLFEITEQNRLHKVWFHDLNDKHQREIVREIDTEIKSYVSVYENYTVEELWETRHLKDRDLMHATKQETIDRLSAEIAQIDEHIENLKTAK